jgi:hypothetical protein
MLWLNKNARIWRIFILVLLLIAFIGPWAYDRINVPAQYECTPPNFRLEGDFCGMPLPGLWAVAVSFGVIFTTLAGEADVTALLLIRVLFGLSVLLTPLPIFSSWFLLSSGEQSWPQVRHVKVWGLAAVGGLGFILLFSSLQGHLSFYLWGAWAYVVLALFALLLEIGGWIGNRRSGLSEVIGG